MKTEKIRVTLEQAKKMMDKEKIYTVWYFVKYEGIELVERYFEWDEDEKEWYTKKLSSDTYKGKYYQNNAILSYGYNTREEVEKMLENDYYIPNAYEKMEWGDTITSVLVEYESYEEYNEQRI